jgi:pimeloyl-ACP methyl ester carboxylesterase
MPITTINGSKLWYTDTEEGVETIFFVHGLLLSGEMYRAQIDSLRDNYRCIAMDLRGQGRSEVSDSGYDIDSLAEDVIKLIEHLQCGPCHFVGLSMGGFIGLRLAIYRADLLTSLALLNTSADPEPAASARQYRIMASLVRLLGFWPVIGRVMKIMFGETLLHDIERRPLLTEWKSHLLSNDRSGIFRAASGVINRAGVYDQLGKIRCPTLVVTGDEDSATPPLRAQRIQAAITGSRLVTIAGAGHSSTIEQPEAVTLALQDFYATLPAAA